VFGSIGGPEVILLFIVALLIFGPRRLPEIGRTVGKAMSGFRRATNEFRSNLEREVELDSLKETKRTIESTPRPDTLARGALQDLAAAVSPAPAPADRPAEPENPVSPANPTSSDGGSGTVH